MKQRIPFLVWLLCVSACGAVEAEDNAGIGATEPNAAQLVRAVRESENWIHRIDSFQLHIQSTWRTPLRPAEAEDQVRRYRVGRPVKSGTTETLEFAFDRRRIRYLNDRAGQSYSLRVWDGNQVTSYHKSVMADKEQYYLAVRPERVFDTFLADMSWLRSQPHSFWFNPKDVNERMKYYGHPKDFVLTDRQDYRGVDCYVLDWKPEEGTYAASGLSWRWHVGAKDGCLYGLAMLHGGQVDTEHFTLDYREIAPGRWFPMKQGYEIHEPDSEGKYYLKTRRDLKTIDVRLNEKLPDELFKIELKEGVEVVDERSGRRISYTYKAPLVGKALPALAGIEIDFDPEQALGNAVLFCFFDFEQRPSRHTVRELAKQAEELKEEGIVVVCVHAAKLERQKLDDWVKKNHIPFRAGMIEGDEEEVRFKWGVKSLPWLIVTDPEHIVRAEGFALTELNTKLKELAAGTGQPSSEAEKKGGLKGDVELLKQTAIAHRKNSKGILTWEGKAQIEQVHEDANGIRFQRKSSADFLLSRDQNATRWRWTTEEYRMRKDGKLILDPNMATTVDAMIIGNTFYRYAPGITTREGKRHNTLVIWPVERARKSGYSDSFDPMWYLTESKYDLVERLLFYYREVRNPELTPGTVRRDGDSVVLETKGAVALNRHQFDLSKGGNLLSYYAEDSQAVEHLTLTYEKNGGVWVPKTFVLSLRKSTADSKIRPWNRKVNFVENIVNRPIDASEFSLNRLGVRYGDRVTDQRADAAYIYNEAEEQKLIQELQSLSTLPRKDGLLIPEFIELLVDKPLPSLEGLDTKFNTKAAEAKNILVCFWDMNQRPSRHCIRELAKRAEVLKEKGVAVVCVQASKVDGKELDDCVKKYNITFPVGMIEGNEEKTRFNWGVKSLPWLILTDEKHIVEAEGFGVKELDQKMRISSAEGPTGTLGPDSIQQLRKIFHAVSKALRAYHIEYTVDKYPLNEEYFAGGNIENAMKSEDPDSQVLRQWLAGMRNSYSCDIMLEVFESYYFCRSFSFDLDDVLRQNVKGEDVSSFDGDQNYHYVPKDNIGTIATDEAGQMPPLNPISIYAETACVMGDPNRYALVSSAPASREGGDQPRGRSLWFLEFRDTTEVEGFHSHQLLVDVSNPCIERNRSLSGSSEDTRQLQKQYLFESFKAYRLGSVDVRLPQTIVANGFPVEGTGSRKEQVVFAEKTVYRLKNVSTAKLTEKSSFGHPFRAGTKVWVKDKDYSYFAEADGTGVDADGRPVPKGPSLVGKSLPTFEGIDIQFEPDQARNKKILACFWDMYQRPSRHCITELAGRTEELKDKNVMILAVQASKIDEQTLNGWIQEHNLPFPVGTVEGDAEQIRAAWGVKSLPWLILTDRNHIVTAEGFGLEELDKRIKATSQK